MIYFLWVISGHVHTKTDATLLFRYRSSTYTYMCVCVCDGIHPRSVEPALSNEFPLSWMKADQARQSKAIDKMTSNSKLDTGRSLNTNISLSLSLYIYRLSANIYISWLPPISQTILVMDVRDRWWERVEELYC